MTSDRPEGARRGRWARYQRPEQSGVGSPYRLSEVDAAAQEEHFGVARDQVELDFVVSHVLAALAPHADRFVFFGGTALSRTILDGLRLSEDIDLLSVGPRRMVAATLDEAIRSGLERGFGEVTAGPSLSGTRTGTTPSVYRIGEVHVQIQLIDGSDFADWPRQTSEVSQRYSGMANLQLQTPTPAGFVGAKTAAWCDTGRNAPRSLRPVGSRNGRPHRRRCRQGVLAPRPHPRRPETLGLPEGAPNRVGMARRTGAPVHPASRPRGGLPHRGVSLGCGRRRTTVIADLSDQLAIRHEQPKDTFENSASPRRECGRELHCGRVRCDTERS